MRSVINRKWTRGTTRSRTVYAEVALPHPPVPADTEAHRAARNLHRWCTGFTKAELDEAACTVTLHHHGGQTLVLHATEHGWHTTPPTPELHVPLHHTAPMSRHLRTLLTGT